MASFFFFHHLINRPKTHNTQLTTHNLTNNCNHLNQEAHMTEGFAISSKPDAIEESVDLTQVSLRTLQLSDLDDLMVWTADEKVARFCSWEPYTSKDDGIKFIEKIASKFLWCRAICLNDRAIGCISLSTHSAHDKARDKSAEIGYVLGSKYWGRGIVTQAVKQLVKAAFSELTHLERLEALVDAENIGSQRVLEKAGFQREGVLRKYLYRKGKSRDTVMFSVVSTDPQL